LDEKLFNVLTIPDDYEVISASQNSLPDLKFPNAGRGIVDKRINQGLEMQNNFHGLNKLKVNQIFTVKGNKLEYGLIHESGESALNEEGQLINKDGEDAEMDEDFSPPKFPIFVKTRIEKISAHIAKVITENKDKEKSFERCKKELKELLDLDEKDFKDFKTPEGKKELEIKISEEAIDKIKKFKLEKKLPEDFDDAFKDKNLLKNIERFWKFDDWLKLRTTYRGFKTKEWDDKISKADKKKDDATKKKRDADKKDREKYKGLEDEENETEKELRKVKKDKQDWLQDFGNIFPANSPPEFKELKEIIDRLYDFIAKYIVPLGEKDLEELEKYKKNLELFLNGPSYPWNVVDQQSEKTVLIIK
jgi:hypothetical protein